MLLKGRIALFGFPKQTLATAQSPIEDISRGLEDVSVRVWMGESERFDFFPLGFDPEVIQHSEAGRQNDENEEHITELI